MRNIYTQPYDTCTYARTNRVINFIQFVRRNAIAVRSPSYTTLWLRDFIVADANAPVHLQTLYRPRGRRKTPFAFTSCIRALRSRTLEESKTALDSVSRPNAVLLKTEHRKLRCIHTLWWVETFVNKAQ